MNISTSRRTVWRGPKLIDWWMCRMAVGHAQQLVGSGLHSATKCHVTCVCTLNAMHENILAEIRKHYRLRDASGIISNLWRYFNLYFNTSR